MILRKTLTVLAVMSLAAPAFAHHSYAMFDRSKTVVLAGAVKSVQMINPHSWLQIVTLDDQGKSSVWSLEMGPPRTLVRDGWTPGVIQPGDAVTLKIHPMRDGTHAGQLVNVQLSSGKTIGGGGPEAD
jgi:hypothetical protein